MFSGGSKGKIGEKSVNITFLENTLNQILPSGGSRDCAYFLKPMKWRKTITHIQQQRQSTVTSWQWQPNIFEEKNICEAKANLIN